MRKLAPLLISVLLMSCGNNRSGGTDQYITVSIAPFKYFIESIAGDDYKINVMVPAGSNPHIYEPFPGQISRLRSSVAYISNGYLGFEMTWLDRFYETNRSMKKLSLGDKIETLAPEHEHEGGHLENADPHYWVSPKCALVMAASCRDFLTGLNPAHKDKYETNYLKLISGIMEIDSVAKELLTGQGNNSFMIYHPNLGYLARDYGLEEITVEYEGKEPTPLRMRQLIDLARKDGLRVIFVQKEYDTKNARAIASEIGAEVRIIDPLSEDWPQATLEIIRGVHDSLKKPSR